MNSYPAPRVALHGTSNSRPWRPTPLLYGTAAVHL
ncbi:polysaccharide deacetylase family protein, partial [Pseudomonas sp. GW460-13]